VSGTIIDATKALLISVRDTLTSTWSYSYYGQHTGESEPRQLNLLTRFHSPVVDRPETTQVDGISTLETLSYTLTDTNLAVNGDMEVDSNWTNISGAAPTFNIRTTDRAHTGTHSRYVGTTAVGKGIEGAAWNMVAGKAYLVTAWVYVNNGSVKMKVTGQTDFDRISSGTGSWQVLKALHVPSADATGKKLQFVSNTATSDFYVDTVSILESTVTNLTQNLGHPGLELVVDGAVGTGCGDQLAQHQRRCPHDQRTIDDESRQRHLCPPRRDQRPGTGHREQQCRYAGWTDLPHCCACLPGQR